MGVSTLFVERQKKTHKYKEGLREAVQTKANKGLNRLTVGTIAGRHGLACVALPDGRVFTCKCSWNLMGRICVILMVHWTRVTSPSKDGFLRVLKMASAGS